MIPRHCDPHGFGMCEAVVLWPIEKKENAHRHCQIVFLFDGFERSIKRRIPHRLVHLHPLCSIKRLDHLLLGPDDQKLTMSPGLPSGSITRRGILFSKSGVILGMAVSGGPPTFVTLAEPSSRMAIFTWKLPSAVEASLVL